MQRARMFTHSTFKATSTCWRRVSFRHLKHAGEGSVLMPLKHAGGGSAGAARTSVHSQQSKRRVELPAVVSCELSANTALQGQEMSTGENHVHTVGTVKYR